MSQPRPPANNSSNSPAPQPFSETGQAKSSQSSSNTSKSSFGEAVTQRVSPKAKAYPPRTPPLNLKRSKPPAPATKPQPELQPEAEPKPSAQAPTTVQPEPVQAEVIQPKTVTSPAPPQPKVEAIALPVPNAVPLHPPKSKPQPVPTTNSTTKAQPKTQRSTPKPAELTEVQPSLPKPKPKPQETKSKETTSQETTPQETKPSAEQPQDSPLTQFIKRFSPLIWAIVILLVLLPLMGRLIIAKSLAPDAPGPHQELVATLPPDLDRLDQDIVTAIQTAHNNSRDYAAAELDAWIAEIDPRVENFLDWYFDYFNQKKLELSAPLTWLTATAGNVITFSDNSPSDVVNAKLTKAFQKEFTKRVLVPQTAQLRLEVITTESADRFVKELQEQMSAVKAKYRIPQGQWDRYLDTIATTVSDTEGHLSNLSLKALAGGTGYLATKPLLVASVGKIGSKISAKFTASATAKVAAKTGSSVAAELGTSLIDPIVGVGILIWDVWDYNHTVAIDRPLLRQNIDGYLQSMERSLLDNPETGVMAAIHQVETSVIKSVRKRRL